MQHCTFCMAMHVFKHFEIYDTEIDEEIYDPVLYSLDVFNFSLKLFAVLHSS